MSTKNTFIVVFGTLLFAQYILPFCITHWVLSLYTACGLYIVLAIARTENWRNYRHLEIFGASCVMIVWPLLLIPILFNDECLKEAIYHDICFFLRCDSIAWQWPLVRLKND